MKRKEIQRKKFAEIQSQYEKNRNRSKIKNRRKK